jgi:hypothetical protein
VAGADPSSSTAQLRQGREAVVREHMDSENRHDFDATIGTFEHARYEIIPTGDVCDGEAAVRRYYEATRAALRARLLRPGQHPDPARAGARRTAGLTSFVNMLITSP